MFITNEELEILEKLKEIEIKTDEDYKELAEIFDEDE